MCPVSPITGRGVGQQINTKPGQGAHQEGGRSQASQQSEEDDGVCGVDSQVCKDDDVVR